LFRNRGRGPVFLPLEDESQLITDTKGDTPLTDDSRKMVKAILAELSDRERELIELRFGLDEERKSRSYQQVAKQVGLSKERVRQLVQKAILTIQTELVLSPGESIS